jgi:septal ring factor EnvC (AmiA/AmiB activator)
MIRLFLSYYSNKFAPLVLSLSLALGMLGGAAASLAQNATHSTSLHEKELKVLQKTVKRVEKRLKRHEGEKRGAAKALRSVELKIGKLATQQRALGRQQAQLQQQLHTLADEQIALTAKADAQQALIASHLRAAYQVGKPNPIKVMLSHSNPAQADRELAYFDYINRARADQLAEFNALIEQKAAIADQIDSKQRALVINVNELAKQSEQLAALMQQRQTALNDIQSAISSDQQQLSKLENDRQRLQILVDEIQKAVSATPDTGNTTSVFQGSWEAFSKARGELPWPVQGKLKNTFGRKRADSDVIWQGVTINADSGKPVRAIYPGTVIFADWFKGQGLLIIVDHGDGYWTLYGRNQSLLQEVGSVVSAGETIATVGNSGGYNNPALYFEIRRNGKPANPARWCRRS